MTGGSPSKVFTTTYLPEKTQELEDLNQEIEDCGFLLKLSGWLREKDLCPAAAQVTTNEMWVHMMLGKSYPPAEFGDMGLDSERADKEIREFRDTISFETDECREWFKAFQVVGSGGSYEFEEYPDPHIEYLNICKLDFGSLLEHR